MGLAFLNIINVIFWFYNYTLTKMTSNQNKTYIKDELAIYLECLAHMIYDNQNKT